MTDRATAAAALRVGYLGPEGTFSHQALLEAGLPAGAAAVALASIYHTVVAVHEGTVDLALVPIENALEGSVDVTLDTLAGDADEVTIVGEMVQQIRNCLIASGPLELSEIQTVYSHPQPIAQCSRLLRGPLARAQVVPVNSTGDAVRSVAATGGAHDAALGNRLAAELYGGHILLEDVDDSDGNVTRFVWLVRRERAAVLRPLVERGDGGVPKTSIVFWGGGDVSPGWLVDCLSEFAVREINLTRIESRPRRIGFGHYMFFADFGGAADDAPVAAALSALAGHCQSVRLLGSYRAT
jgi:prephenate dehydratase